MNDVVILEDSEFRIKEMNFVLQGCSFAVTDSVEKFLSLVAEAEEAGTLKLVIMDHDLGRVSGDGLRIRFDADESGLNGHDAAKQLTTSAPVLIWSLNDYGALSIELTLQQKGIRTIRLPFLEWNFKNIKETIERALK